MYLLAAIGTCKIIESSTLLVRIVMVRHIYVLVLLVDRGRLVVVGVHGVSWLVVYTVSVRLLWLINYTINMGYLIVRYLYPLIWQGRLRNWPLS